jgi:tetratricopeptide (TPR) repeat protein
MALPGTFSAALVVAMLLCSPSVRAQTPPADAAEATAQPTEAVVNSALDDRLFYQLLIGEMALTAGDAGSAYELMLDAARRTRDDGLFRRAVDIALQARSGEQALAATRAWRTASPKSQDALRLQLQILVLLNRPKEVGEPLKQLLALTLPADLPDLMGALPRLLQRASDPKGVAVTIEEALKPYRGGSTAVAARVAQGRAWLEAREPERALAYAREGQAADPQAPGPVLLALDLMREQPAAEALVQTYLKQTKPEPALRMAYVRVLGSLQRYADAVRQLEAATRLQPEVAAPYLSLGALQLELKQAAAGEAALQRYVDLTQKQAAQTAMAGDAPVTKAARPAAALPTPVSDSDGDGDEEDEAVTRPEQGLVQAWLLLAQSAEQRGDFAAAERWLSKIDDPQRALEVQTRRASILVRQGQLAQARELIRKVPEQRAEDARAKLLAEASLLRDAKRWSDAFDVLGAASQRFENDSDLIYEQAMMAEKLDRLDLMEKLLRQVIALKPDNAHAHNALGYSLADRQQRLPEAHELIQRALELSPGDPFITDSLGWVEFRMGRSAEALRLLRAAYGLRPDTEIAAHLGEVLWADGQRDEARRVFREGRSREPGNEVLSETLTRLRVDL